MNLRRSARGFKQDSVRSELSFQSPTACGGTRSEIEKLKVEPRYGLCLNGEPA
jgi:hypothetical protein